MLEVKLWIVCRAYPNCCALSLVMLNAVKHLGARRSHPSRILRLRLRRRPEPAEAMTNNRGVFG